MEPASIASAAMRHRVCLKTKHKAGLKLSQMQTIQLFCGALQYSCLDDVPSRLLTVPNTGDHTVVPLQVCRHGSSVIMD
jgi:hypothetical protein